MTAIGPGMRVKCIKTPSGTHGGRRPIPGEICLVVNAWTYSPSTIGLSLYGYSDEDDRGVYFGWDAINFVPLDGDAEITRLSALIRRVEREPVGVGS